MRTRGGIISARTGYEERQELKKQAAAAGFDNLSDFIRFKLGLPRGVGLTAPIPEMNDIDDITGLLKSYVTTIELLHRMNVTLNHIAAHLAVPTEKVPPAGFTIVKAPEPEGANGGFNR